MGDVVKVEFRTPFEQKADQIMREHWDNMNELLNDAESPNDQLALVSLNFHNSLFHFQMVYRDYQDTENDLLEMMHKALDFHFSDAVQKHSEYEA